MPTIFRPPLRKGPGQAGQRVVTRLTLTGRFDRPKAGPLILSPTFFHVCHCLLYHPLLFRRRLVKIEKKAPMSFLNRSQESCRIHARELTLNIREVNDAGCLNRTSFNAYCFMVAGSVHALFLSQDDNTLHPTSQESCGEAVRFLQMLAKFWKPAGVAVRN